MTPRRTIVEDLGSNSFRMVVYEWEPGSWWRRADELHETVRIGEGLESAGVLSREGIERGLRAVELFGHARKASGIAAEDTIAVATSAIRDAANGPAFIERAEREVGASIRVLSTAEEARYGMLAGVNSTTLNDGWTLDLGGGSMQLCKVEGRRSKRCGSWPLGAVRMTEHYLSGEGPASRGEITALRTHVSKSLQASGLEPGGDHVVGVGGAVRNLAAAARIEAGLPSVGVQGYELQADQLEALIDRIAVLPANKRRSVPGIKTGRGEIVLAAAVVISETLDFIGADSIEVTEAGLREGLFFERFLAPADPPVFRDVRGASVRNLALQHRVDVEHAERVADLALGMYDSLKDTGLRPGNGKLRELLWAAAMLHDIGKTIDYDDHHRHSRYLILGAGLPGYSPRELAMIALMARYHRKGNPDLGDLAGLMTEGDAERLKRCSVILRLAEFLERGRDGAVESAALVPNGKGIHLELAVKGDAALARWGAERQADAFASAFGRDLLVGP